MSACNVYIDESGDLGWTFKKVQGATKYLTISYLIIPEESSHYPRRLVKRVRDLCNTSLENELKGKDLFVENQITVARRAVSLINQNVEATIGAITIDKRKVPEHMRRDSNLLYNYMLNVALLGKVKDCESVTLVLDKRTIKLKSENSAIDYFRTELIFNHKSDTRLSLISANSEDEYNIQFIDWISYIIWSNYETGNSPAYKMLAKHIHDDILVV